MGGNMVSFRYFMLGLLTQRPMSGYDIKRFLDSLSWLIGSPSFGSLYPALHALLKDELVSMKVVPRDGKPPRKIYSITQTGKQTLKTWINQPATSRAPLKAFVMRLVLADNFSRTGLIAHLQQRRDQVAAYHATLEETTRAMREETELAQHLALDYGSALAAAELAWLDSTLDQLSQARQQL